MQDAGAREEGLEVVGDGEFACAGEGVDVEDWGCGGVGGQRSRACGGGALCGRHVGMVLGFRSCRTGWSVHAKVVGFACSEERRVHASSSVSPETTYVVSLYA